MPAQSSVSARGISYVIVGFSLILAAPVVGQLDVGDPDTFRYEAIEVTVEEDGTIAFDPGMYADNVDPEIACLRAIERRSCILERAVLEQGGIQYDGPPSGFLRHEYDYVYVYGEGFYETATYRQNGSVLYTHDPVPGTEALSGAANDSKRIPKRVHRAIEARNYTTSDELSMTNELVEHEGGYYVLTRTEGHWRRGERTILLVVFEWGLWILGGGLVLRGQRLRVRDGSD